MYKSRQFLPIGILDNIDLIMTHIYSPIGALVVHSGPHLLWWYLSNILGQKGYSCIFWGKINTDREHSVKDNNLYLFCSCRNWRLGRGTCVTT